MADTPEQTAQAAAAPAADQPKKAKGPLDAAGAAGLVNLDGGLVLGFKDYGTKVVVVTTDGRRLEATR